MFSVLKGNRRWFLSSLLIVLVLLTAAAQVPTLTQAAGIQSQEVKLEAAYFAANGSLEGLVAGPQGLTLATDQVEGRYVSGVVESSLAFTTDLVPLWSAELPDGTDIVLEIRHRLEDGSWGEWNEAPVAFYPVREELYSGNLVWVGRQGAAVQFKATLRTEDPALSPVLGAVIFAFSDTSAGPTDAEVAAQVDQVGISGDVCPLVKPAVVSRTAWGSPDGQYSPRPPVYEPVSHVILHQTETPNCTSPYCSWAGWVRSVWNFHANILGWGDIGYNYLVDPNGIIYEGRAGGEDVVGIHDGHNYGSMGLAFVGCYGGCDNPYLRVAQPSQAMLNSAVHLMAWKLGERNIDPLSSSYYAGRNLPVIAGGRDVVPTTSPGDNIYYRIPEMRQQASSLVQCPATPTPAVTLTPTATTTPELRACQVRSIFFDKDQYTVGDTINLTVRLADFQGNPLGGAQVTAEVEKEIEISQAPTGFGFVDRTGEYDGVYTNTDVAGAYRFAITGSDPTGDNFLPCTAEEVVLVVDDNEEPTATPTPTGTVSPSPTPTPTGTLTPSPTPTSTPTETPTPTPTSTTVPDLLTFDPLNLDIPSGGRGTSEVVIRDLDGLTAFDLAVTFDPQVLEAVQIVPNPLLGENTGVIARNEIDNVNGRIYFAGALLSPNQFDSDDTLFEIDWRAVGSDSSPLRLVDVILVGGTTQLSPVIENGSVQITAAASTVSGSVALQGRSSHANVVVTSDTGQQAQTDAEGFFTIQGSSTLQVAVPGYLSAQANLADYLQAQAGAEVASLGAITLLAGDTNGDNAVNILDLAYIAMQYQSGDSLADLNTDGVVNIVDLALAAGNYSQQGPLTNWQ